VAADRDGHPALPPVTLVLGGARSGKSRHGEALIAAWPGRRVYLATARPGDSEMAARIAAHRARRGADWQTVEEPLDLTGALARGCAPERAVLVECLTLWLANLLDAGRDPDRETDRLIAALPDLAGPVVFISNEVGLGIVPDNPLGRRFVDAAGRLHQALAAAAASVIYVTAGLALPLKPPATRMPSP